MKAVFVAAGKGHRLRPLTERRPKCMLPLDGRPILERNVDVLRAVGVEDFAVVVGYRKEMVRLDAARRFENPDYERNNILHSLMCATPVFEECIAGGEDLVISYSDIVFEAGLVERLTRCPGEIALSVDLDWIPRYEGRTEHPISEAENVEIDDEDRAIRLGKGLADGTGRRVGEFTGLLKLRPSGARRWLDHFRRLGERLDPDDPFHRAEEFCKAYLTDFLQDLVDHGVAVTCSTYPGGWMEFDTPQDYEKLLEIWSSTGASSDSGRA